MGDLQNLLTQINPFITIFLFWTGLFLVFAGISFWLWKTGIQIKNRLKPYPDARFFEKIEIHTVSKNRFSYNFSIPCKIDVAVFRNEIHFLPHAFSVFLFSNPVPASVNLKLNQVETEEKFSQSILLKFDSNALDIYFKFYFGIKTNFECTLKFQNSLQRSEFIHLISKEAN